MTLLSNRKFQILPQRQKRRQQQPSQAPPNKVIDDNDNGEIDDDDDAKNDVDNENHDLRPHQKQREIPAQQQQQDQR